MAAARSPYPGLQALRSALSDVLPEKGGAGALVSILQRRPNPYTSTFPGEIITVLMPDGRQKLVLGKYGGNVEEDKEGHRRGLDYEIAVYSEVLRPIGLSTPEFCGGYRDPETGQSWLFLEYVDNTWRVHKTPSPRETVPLAAQWIGRFHASAAKLVSRTPPSFLVRYDAEYYLRWARRASRATSGLRDRWPWLLSLFQRAEELFPVLEVAEDTIIHGEYFPKNVLFRKERICPVDWQTAARAPGEIDLAALISGHWGEEFVRQCVREYQQTRWSGNPPPDFEFRFSLARLYWPMRFLGDTELSLSHEDAQGWIDEMRSPCERLGLI